MSLSKIASIGAILAALCGVSCKVGVGLGESIDTESPIVDITYPAETSIIRDSFILCGTCKDDKGVSSVKVSVKSTLTNETVISEAPATINKDNTWQIELNKYDSSNTSYYNGWQLADGTYQVSVVAADDAGRDVSATRVFDIDNTPPVLVLTKPTTAGSGTAKSYGRAVQLEGIFSESCSSGISELVVRFYNVAGEYLFDSSFSNILDMSNANPLTIAEYYDSGDEPEPSSENYVKWQNYQKLYGAQAISDYRENGTALSAQFYFTVAASDAAEVYKNADSSETFEGGGKRFAGLLPRHYTDAESYQC